MSDEQRMTDDEYIVALRCAAFSKTFPMGNIHQLRRDGRACFCEKLEVGCKECHLFWDEFFRRNSVQPVQLN